MARGRRWLVDAIGDYRRIVGAEGYPCHFATTSIGQGTSAYLALPASDDRTEALAGALTSIAECRDLHLQSLVTFSEPVGRESVEDAFDRTWRVLRDLHRRDPSDWPSDIPTDGDAAQWEFCFAGIGWFVLSCSPGYVRRRSRNLGGGLITIFQPSWTFEGLKSSSIAGRHAKVVIRERLLAYDGVADPQLGPIERSSRPKWPHYLLPDIGQAPLSDACPFDTGSAP